MAGSISSRVELPLRFSEATCQENVWESGGIAPRVLNLDLRGEWSASRIAGFSTGERAPGTHWVEGSSTLCDLCCTVERPSLNKLRNITMRRLAHAPPQSPM